MSICPLVEVGSLVNDLAPETIECRPYATMPPLRKLLAIADDFKFRVSEHICSRIIE